MWLLGVLLLAGPFPVGTRTGGEGQTWVCYSVDCNQGTAFSIGPSSGVGQMKFGAWSCEVTPTLCLLSLGSHVEDPGGAVALWSEAGLGWAEAVGCHSQQAGLAHAAPGDPGMWSA